MTGEREPIDPLLAPAIDEARIAATWNRIAARRWPAARARWPWLVATSIAVAAAVLVVIAWPRVAVPTALTSRDPRFGVAPGTVWNGAAHDVALDDDSTIELDPDARLEILANDGTRFATLLASGSARFDVQPGGPRRWEIETAIATIEVVGTAFRVDLRDGQLRVAVARGVVLVHGELVPGRVARLTAGTELVIRPHGVHAPVAQIPVPVTTASATPPARAVAHPRISSVRPQSVAPAFPTTPAPATPPEPRTLSSAESVAEADRLIEAGNPAAAAALLERARRVDPDQGSGLIAFTLGRIYLDALGEPMLAVGAFEDVIAHGSPRSLLEDAHARRIEALLHAGQRDRAAAALAEYAGAYPSGRRLAALRRLVQ